MATITISKNLIMEKDLIIVPRLEYQNLLKYTVVGEEHESLWLGTSRDKFFESYSSSDSIYDQI